MTFCRGILSTSKDRYIIGFGVALSLDFIQLNIVEQMIVLV